MENSPTSPTLPPAGNGTSPPSVLDASANLVRALAAAHAAAASGNQDGVLSALADAQAAQTVLSTNLTTPSSSSAMVPSPTPVPSSITGRAAPLPPAIGGLNIPSVKTHVPFVLDTKPPNYTRWRTVVVAFLGKFGMLPHVLNDIAPADPDGSRAQDDFAVLTALYCAIHPDVLDLLVEPAQSARALWKAAEHMFHDNRETRIIYQETEFRSLNQGDMSITEYCRRLKTLADSLRDLGEPISDRTLVLNLIRGLSPRFSTQADLLPLQVPFPSFSAARSALLLAEMRHAGAASINGDTSLFVKSSSTTNSTNSKGKNGSAFGDYDASIALEISTPSQPPSSPPIRTPSCQLRRPPPSSGTAAWDTPDRTLFTISENAPPFLVILPLAAMHVA
uniref:Retrotransposon gag domain-containing protein n=1 Tax=Oryza brachyantha TaxID=4533 RepID=J3MIG3_ORYBR